MSGPNCEYARLKAMGKQCREKGGSCNCGTTCKALSEVSKKTVEIHRELYRFENLRKWISHTPCSVRPDWQKPEKPDGDYRLCAHNTGDGWLLHWYSETEENDALCIEGDDGWPFVEKYAFSEDWERIGVEVI